jgi:hypothetical protein
MEGIEGSHQVLMTERGAKNKGELADDILAWLANIL